MIKEIKWNELQNILETHSAVLVDVRELEELEESGTAPGALHWPLSEFESMESEITKKTSIVFFCRSGRRSLTAARIALGHKPSMDVFSVQGGFLDYKPQ